MDMRLSFLESFSAKGSDGRSYRVSAFERMVPEVPFTHSYGMWEPTGVAEYHLDDGRLVEVQRDGSMHIARSDVTLVPVERAAARSAR